MYQFDTNRSIVTNMLTASMLRILLGLNYANANWCSWKN